MRVETGLTTQRKLLAQAIGEWLHMEPHYDGVPRCTYSIGSVKVEKDAAIVTDDLEAWTALQPFFQNHGWAAEEPQTEQPAPEADSEATDIEAMEISEPAPGLTVGSLSNLIHMLYSKQYLFNRMTESGSLFISKNLIDSLKEHMPEDLAAFQQRLADSKTRGELDGFSYLDGNVTLRYPFHAEQPMRWTTYGLLTDKIIKAAQSATRITAQVQEPENEKYFARSWLLRLGMGGADFKEERRILLGGLNGHAAFPNDVAAQKHKEKYAALRRDAHAADGKEETE
ncbi:hypothetical protein ACH6CV_10200 [Bacillota bacterium Meth-B3]